MSEWTWARWGRGGVRESEREKWREIGKKRVNRLIKAWKIQKSKQGAIMWQKRTQSTNQRIGCHRPRRHHHHHRRPSLTSDLFSGLSFHLLPLFMRASRHTRSPVPTVSARYKSRSRRERAPRSCTLCVAPRCYESCVLRHSLHRLWPWEQEEAPASL